LPLIQLSRQKPYKTAWAWILTLSLMMLSRRILMLCKCHGQCQCMTLCWFQMCILPKTFAGVSYPGNEV
jgi:hypothetical protein